MAAAATDDIEPVAHLAGACQEDVRKKVTKQQIECF
jgi:hypothetical protein